MGIKHKKPKKPHLPQDRSNKDCGLSLIVVLYSTGSRAKDVAIFYVHPEILFSPGNKLSGPESGATLLCAVTQSVTHTAH